MAARKGIGKKVRFEVFKRDSFTCQYCGVQAPDAVLVIDHINPVAGGGDNDIMNLITSCDPCNSGKGARELDDNRVIAKQKAQLDALNERREQLEMMLQWRQALANLDDDAAKAFAEAFAKAVNYSLNDYGISLIKKWLKKHSLSELLDALEGAVSTYFKAEPSDGPDVFRENVITVLDMIPRVASARKRNADKPWMKDLFYIRAIIRNRMYCNERVAVDLLEQAYHAGAPLIDLQDWAKRAKNWTRWRREMEDWIDELGNGDPE